MNLEKALSNRKVNYAKNREAVKASTSSYRKEMRIVNKDKERAATRHSVKNVTMQTLSTLGPSLDVVLKNSLKRTLSMLEPSLDIVLKNSLKRAMSMLEPSLDVVLNN